MKGGRAMFDPFRKRKNQTKDWNIYIPEEGFNRNVLLWKAALLQVSFLLFPCLLWPSEKKSIDIHFQGNNLNERRNLSCHINKTPQIHSRGIWQWPFLSFSVTSRSVCWVLKIMFLDPLVLWKGQWYALGMDSSIDSNNSDSLNPYKVQFTSNNLDFSFSVQILYQGD